LHKQQSHKKSHVNPISAIRHKRWEVRMDSLTEERVHLQRRLIKVTQETGRYNAWVLLGEAYVEGIIHGKAASEFPVERITVM
jgi:hypothetical protein